MGDVKRLTHSNHAEFLNAYSILDVEKLSWDVKEKVEAQQQALIAQYQELSELTRITLEKSDRGEELETYPSVEAFFKRIEEEESCFSSAPQPSFGLKGSAFSSLTPSDSRITIHISSPSVLIPNVTHVQVLTPSASGRLFREKISGKG